MKVLSLTLDEEALPASITVTMTRDEAILIADYVGALVPVVPTSHNIYDALVGSVFNRFWEDGLNDARKEALDDSE